MARICAIAHLLSVFGLFYVAVKAIHVVVRTFDFCWLPYSSPTFWLLWIMLPRTWAYDCAFKPSSLFCVCNQEGKSQIKLILCLNIWESPCCYPQWLYCFSFPQECSHILPANTCYFLFSLIFFWLFILLMKAILMNLWRIFHCGFDLYFPNY